MGHKFELYCKDYENIENYEKAKADDFKNWEVHHRLETHNSDGERRLVDISHNELKALGMYYNRPAEELIFLTSSEHQFLHKKGKQLSEETRNKMSEAKKNMSEETKKKLSEAKKGNKNVRGTRWYNNGNINIMSKECPEGFVTGSLLIK